MKGSNNQKNNPVKKEGDSLKNEERVNDTYGHLPDQTVFKRKDETDKRQLTDGKIIASNKLKDINLLDDEIANRNAVKERGLKGKRL